VVAAPPDQPVETSRVTLRTPEGAVPAPRRAAAATRSISFAQQRGALSGVRLRNEIDAVWVFAGQQNLAAEGLTVNRKAAADEPADGGSSGTSGRSGA
jgi:hypothetical protein